MPKDQRAKLYRLIKQEGIVSLMNDTKWMQTLDALEKLHRTHTTGCF